MISMHQRSVNVSRVELLAKLRENLEQYRIDYAETLREYHTRLEADLKLALKKVQKTDDPRKLAKFAFSLPFPKNNTSEYTDIIEMLEMSVDENINLDSESFRAFIKNEWTWKLQFDTLKTSYGVVGSALRG